MNTTQILDQLYEALNIVDKFEASCAANYDDGSEYSKRFPYQPGGEYAFHRAMCLLAIRIVETLDRIDRERNTTPKQPTITSSIDNLSSSGGVTDLVVPPSTCDGMHQGTQVGVSGQRDRLTRIVQSLLHNLSPSSSGMAVPDDHTLPEGAVGSGACVSAPGPTPLTDHLARIAENADPNTKKELNTIISLLTKGNLS
jgi:hypothetical protein